ncbi:MAG: FHA domain-containing protein [Faecousia sp.]
MEQRKTGKSVEVFYRISIIHKLPSVGIRQGLTAEGDECERKMPVRCPYCSTELNSTADRCPRCGRMLRQNGNAAFFMHVQKGTLSIGEILSDAPRRHSHQELVDSLTRRHEPGRNMLASWHKPWIFLRVFLFLFATSAILYGLIKRPFALNLYISLGSLVIPLTLAIFIWEMDIPANVTLLDMLLLLMFGGLLSMLFAMDWNAEVIRNKNYAYLAGFTEEPAKLLVCILFMCLSKRRFYGLDGLAIGAAVGAGFAFMESIQYVYLYNSISLVLMRGIHAINSHILYTAPYTGMLAMVMNGKKLQSKHLTDLRFLTILGCCILSHVINNSYIDFFVLETVSVFSFSVKDILNTIFIWSVFLFVMKTGICEVLNHPKNNGVAWKMPTGRIEEHTAIRRSLYGTNGEYSQRSISPKPGDSLILGRNPSKCHVCFSNPKVSGVHCGLYCTANGLEVCDLGSRNGTYVNGKRLMPNQRIIVRPGDTICLYDEEFVVC